MRKTYTSKEVADIAGKVTFYWEREHAWNIAKLNADRWELSLKARELLNSIQQMRKIPENVRIHLSHVKADNNTLDNLEKKCAEKILEISNI